MSYKIHSPDTEAHDISWFGTITEDTTADSDYVYTQLDVTSENFEDEISKTLYVLKELSADDIPDEAAVIKFSYYSEHTTPVLIEEENVSIVQDGESAEISSVSPSSDYITVDENGNLSADSITWSFSKTVGSTTSSDTDIYYEIQQYKDGVWTTITPRTKSTTGTAVTTVDKTVKAYKCYVYESASATESNEIETVLILSSSSGIQVDLTNETCSLSKTTSGTIDYSGSSTILNVYDGTAILEYVSSLDSYTDKTGKYECTVTASGCTKGTVSKDNKSVKLDSVSGMTGKSASVTFTAHGYSVTGEEFTKTAVFKLSISEQGETGTSACDIRFSPTTYSFMCDANGKALSSTLQVKIVVVQDGSSLPVTYQSISIPTASYGSTSAIGTYYTTSYSGSGTATLTVSIASVSDALLPNDTIATIKISYQPKDSSGNVTGTVTGDIQIPLKAVATGVYIGAVNYIKNNTYYIKDNLGERTVSFSDVHSGDWFLFTGTSSDPTQTVSIGGTSIKLVSGCRYVYNGTILIQDKSETHLIESFGDSINYASSLTTSDDTVKVLKSLTASIIEVGSLFANKIVLANDTTTGKKGIIMSHDYAGTIGDDQTITAYNTDSSKQGWAIDYNGKADFTNMNAVGGTFNTINVTGDSTFSGSLNGASGTFSGNIYLKNLIFQDINAGDIEIGYFGCNNISLLNQSRVFTIKYKGTYKFVFSFFFQVNETMTFSLLKNDVVINTFSSADYPQEAPNAYTTELYLNKNDVLKITSDSTARVENNYAKAVVKTDLQTDSYLYYDIKESCFSGDLD